MAFRTLQVSVSLLLQLVVCAHFITDNRTTATNIRQTCECVEETGSVQWRKIRDYTIIPKDSLCNNVQIILQLPGKQVCLNPESVQGKKIQRCWKRIKFNTQQKKICLTHGKKKKGPKNPQKKP